MLHSAGTSEETKCSKPEAAAQVQVHVKDAAGMVEFTFPDHFSSEVAQEDVEGCAFVQGLLEAAASSPDPLSMPAVQHRCLRAWLEAVNAGAEWLQQADAGTVAQWLQVRRMATCSPRKCCCWVLLLSEGLCV